MDNLADQAPQSGLTVANGMARWHFLSLLTRAAQRLWTSLASPSAEGRETAIETLSKRFDVLDRQLEISPISQGRHLLC
jgi:hypothetical protein